MGKAKTIFLLGLLVIILPFLGLPSSWKTVASVIIGLSLISLAYAFREPKKSTVEEIKTESFSESLGPQNFNEK